MLDSQAPRRGSSVFLSDSTEESDLKSEDESQTVRNRRKVTVDNNLTVIIDDRGPSTSTVFEFPANDASPTSAYSRGLDMPSSFFEYVWSELTKGYSLDNDQSRYTEKRRKVYAFFRIPYEFEKFIFFGMMQCVDAFCYLFTFLPIRILMSLISTVCRFRRLTAAELVDILKVGIIFGASAAMQYIDTSMVYHQVRGQGVIKLYMFFNMLEVADKLFSSLGQDVLDSLFWTANEKWTIRNLCRFALHFVFAVVYATLHTFLVLLQATTLNVAFNSHNQSLLMIMMSNNFVELKGSVFKKFAKANLFQMSCSDVRERFHIMALLVVVLLRNMMAVNWSADHFYEMIPDLAMIWIAELIVDYLKHAFITKFNEISAEVYKDFTLTIAFDVVKSRDESAFSDYSDQVSRRMGFIPIPLSIMLIRVVSQTFSFTCVSNLIIFGLLWIFMLTIKICNGVLLLGKACQLVSSYRDLQSTAELNLFRKRILDKKSKSAPSSPKISLIDFHDVLHPPAAEKGFTMSEVIRQLENIADAPSPYSIIDERTPRRTKSFAHLARSRRDTSEPPASTEAEIENKQRESVSGENREREDSGQDSPRKKVKEEKPAPAPPVPGDDSETLLSDVTAYTMLQPEQGVQRIE